MSPVSRGKSALAAKLGAKLSQAVEAHANDETEYGPIRLPAGIRNGIAKLVECKFDVFKTGANTGKYYFRAAGVVVEPDVAPDGTPVRGQQTSIIEPLCDTKKGDGTVVPLEEHVANVLNEMRKLGGEGYTSGATADDLEQLAADLKESGPHFRFSTSQGQVTPQFPNPRVWENWHGSKGLEEYNPDEAGGGVEDATGGDGQTTDTEPDANPEGMDEYEVQGEGDDETGAATGTEGEEDLDALAEQAAADDSDAQDRLEELAIQAGYTKKQVKQADSWQEVAGWAKEGQAAGGGDGEGGDEAATEAEEPEEQPPVKGEVYSYRPLDPKTKKPVKKPLEVEVLAVYKKNSTVDAKLLSTGKVLKGLPWAKLQVE